MEHNYDGRGGCAPDCGWCRIDDLQAKLAAVEQERPRPVDGLWAELSRVQAKLAAAEHLLNEHDLVCNADRHTPPGCSCLGRARRALAAAEQREAEQQVLLDRYLVRFGKLEPIPKPPGLEAALASPTTPSPAPSAPKEPA